MNDTPEANELIRTLIFTKPGGEPINYKIARVEWEYRSGRVRPLQIAYGRDDQPLPTGAPWTLAQAMSLVETGHWEVQERGRFSDKPDASYGVEAW